MFKKKKRRTFDNIATFDTQVGGEAVLEGKLSGVGHHAIRGTIIGECDIKGILYIEAGGHWRGNILADVVIIAGSVDGNLQAREKIELHATGRVTGNLAAPAVAIAEGAALEGRINTPAKDQVTHYTERRGAKKPDKKD